MPASPRRTWTTGSADAELTRAVKDVASRSHGVPSPEGGPIRPSQQFGRISLKLFESAPHPPQGHQLGGILIPVDLVAAQYRIQEVARVQLPARGSWPRWPSAIGTSHSMPICWPISCRRSLTVRSPTGTRLNRWHSRTSSVSVAFGSGHTSPSSCSSVLGPIASRSMTDSLAAKPNVHGDSQSHSCDATDERNDEVARRTEDHNHEQGNQPGDDACD